MKQMTYVTKNENSLTYDNCAMKPMNSNGKPRNETRAWKWNVEVWFNVKVHGWIFNENVYVAACMEVRRTAFLFGGWLWTAPQSLSRDGSEP
jgi:hypothetical protein